MQRTEPGISKTQCGRIKPGFTKGQGNGPNQGFSRNTWADREVRDGILEKELTMRFPVTTLKCEPMGWSMHRMGVVNSAITGYEMAPEDAHKGISTPAVWNSVPLARNKVIKDLLQFAPFITVVCKT